MLDEDDSRVLRSVDGVGAFDSVRKTRFFKQLVANPQLTDMLPFVMQWYAGQSRFLRHDDHGTLHEVLQGDGGEQCDALMPALLCLALRDALEEIQNQFPTGSCVFYM